MGLLNECGWLVLKAANGLDIPYVGYLELDVVVMGKTLLPKQGVLVIKDSTDSEMRERKKLVPGLVGMNIIQKCHDILKQQHGAHYWKNLVVQQCEATFKQALEICQSVKNKTIILYT